MSRSDRLQPARTWIPRAGLSITRPSLWRVCFLVVACVAAVLIALLAVTWLTTPSTADAAQRAQAISLAHGGDPIGPRQLPPTLIDALLATEDASFYSDHGVNLEGTARAALFDVSHRCACEGGSGITQQLAEDLYLQGSDASLPRYWRDAVLALKIDLRLSKSEILAAYLSEVYLGHGAYGVAAASRIYFHRPVDGLSLTQYAMLAGLPRAPSAYDPILHPEAARARVREVLAAMVERHYLTSPQAARAAQGSL